jgi:predicted GNAT family acetyltransferase
MDIKLEQGQSKGAFYVEDNGVRQAEMSFTKAGESRIIINHTEVSDSLRGTGAGLKLVAAGVKFARKNNLKIIPYCTFAKSVFDRKPSIATFDG